MDFDNPKKFKTGKQKLKEFLEKEREVVRKKEYITRSKQIKSSLWVNSGSTLGLLQNALA